MTNVVISATEIANLLAELNKNLDIESIVIVSGKGHRVFVILK